MSTTVVTVEGAKYEYYYRDNHRDNKREILLGSKAVETFSEISVVDIGRIFSKELDERKAAAQEISDICKKIGLMYIKNHGVSQELIEEVFSLSKAYHAQPADVKMKNSVYNNKMLRGFDQHHADTPGGPVLKKGSFLYSYDPENDPTPPELSPEQREMCLGTHNQFPETPLNFENKLLEYQRELLKLARCLMRSFVFGLGSDEPYFDDIITAPFVSIILQHYLPTHPEKNDLDSLGAHTDFETFTILNQDSVGGLKILNKNGIYIPAPYVHGTFVVNIGDFLERISNDTFVSTVHRVRNSTGKERYSIPFFSGFNMDASVGVLPSCMSTENPAKYEPRNLHEYTAKRRAKQRAHHNAPGLDNPLA